MAKKELSDKGPDGTSLGQSATDKVAFFGVTPAAQRSGATQSTITVTIATADSGFMFATSAGFNAAIDQLKEVAATLTALGLWKGSS